MPLFILQTRLSPDALHQPKSFETLERHVSEQLHAHCPDVTWVASYAVTGPCDYIDVFDAPDLEAAARVSVLVRSYGRSQTEIWPAMEWKDFKSMLRTLPNVRT